MPRPRTWVEINADALAANYRTFRRLLPRNVEIAPVIKANAYGHDARIAAQILAREQIWGFCVASGDEALGVRALYRGKILVLTSWRPAELPALIRQRIALVAWDIPSAVAIDRAARRVGRQANVHLKIDTGASRIGVQPHDVPTAVVELRRLASVRLNGIFSHFADSEDSRHEAFTRAQDEIFRHAAQLARGVRWRHIACTAATLQYPFSRHNLVRLGIGLYGLWPSSTVRQAVHRRQSSIALRPVLSWRTTLLQVKDLPPRTPVGYGLTYRTRRRTRLGVIPVGYWDGYDRSLSNRAHVLVGGRRAPVVGRVCMNVTMLDCTGILSARAGETVTLIGADGQLQVTADAMADWAKTITYEVVTRINPSIPRLASRPEYRRRE